MQTFLLILRILLLIGFVAGIIISLISGTIAKAKKFQKENQTSYYQSKIKVIGYLVSGISLAVLMIISLF